MNIDIYILHYAAYALCLYYMIQPILNQNKINRRFSDIFIIMDKETSDLKLEKSELFALERLIQRSKKLDSYMVYYCIFMFFMGVFNVYASVKFMELNNISYLLILILFISGVFTTIHTTRSKVVLQNFEEMLNDLKAKVL